MEKEKKKIFEHKNLGWQKSFAVAAGGFVSAVKNEASCRRAVFFAFLFITLTCFFHTHYLEVLIVILAWTQVIVYEMFNTAIEKVLDYTSNYEYSPLVKRAKDFAAASVFIAASLGGIIFGVVMGKYFLGQ